MAQDRKQQLKELSSYLQDRGFVYGPSPELYGGVAGFYDYGPLGKLVKNKVEAVIRRVFTRQSFFEVECPTVVPREVWEASGHLGGFTDPLIKDKAGNIYRADNLIEEHCLDNNITNVHPDGMSSEKLLETIKKLGIKSPNGEELIPEITNHNLMMKTTVGLDREAYNRPETATTTYLPFMRYVNFFRDKLPFGVFQIGKAYRNEISPRQYMLRMREFTQAEAQLFLFKSQKDNFEGFDDVKDSALPLWRAQDQEAEWKYNETKLGEAIENKFLKNKAYAWTLALAYNVFISMGIPKNRIRLRQHASNELAFYAEDAWDLEVNLNTFGWTELCGIHDRKDYDLGEHAKHSKTELFAMTQEGKRETPHVLEIAFGTDRPTFALLDLFYELKDKEEGKTTLSLPYHMSPIQLCVFPLTNKLHEKASELYKKLQDEFICMYDKAGSIGKRYLRADSIGVPFCVTVDFDTLQDGTVTIRDRDSSEQKRVSIEKLVHALKSGFNMKNM